MTILIKRDGSTAQFEPAKVRQWVSWAVNSTVSLEDKTEAEYHILQETIGRLPERVTTEELHQTMINVCLNKEEVQYSRVAAVLEKASIYKNLERAGFMYPQGADFDELAEFFYRKGLWVDILADATEEQIQEINEVYIELEALELEFWVVKQWREKYSKNVGYNKEVETPAMGALAISIALHGVTELAFKLARAVCLYKINLPTPVNNGLRDGNTDTISCCVIEGGDTVDSLEVANFLASRMTAKKAGIGIMLNTRAKGDPVKNGEVTHLGKAPLYRAVESAVKKFTQLTRGGSATMSFRANDPDVMSILLWKTQRIDIAQRIDKIDYEFVYNDAFIDALLNEKDWYLFSPYWAPEVHANFHAENYMEYVKDALERKVPHTKIKAMDILREFGRGRWETGRLYCQNATRMNNHTPFLDPIVQSNLCLEIALPTKPFIDMHDFVSDNPQGEMAFCAIAAINVSAVSLGEYFEIAEIALETVDVMIERAVGISPGIDKQLKTRRSVGIGITGLASFLYKQGLDYDGSYESLVAVEQLAATHYYALLQASQKMSARDGFAVEGVDLNWLPVDTAKTLTREEDWEVIYDWEALRGKPRKHSVLVAHMPCESSSMFSNSTNGLYPTRRRAIYKKARTGQVQFIVPEYDDTKMSVWDVDMVPYYQAIQNHTDQAISADYYTDFTKYPDRKIYETEIISWFIRQAKAGIKTAYYQNFRDTNNHELKNIKLEDDDSCCKL